MDKHMAYVAGSRHTHDCFFHTTADAHEELEQMMARSAYAVTAADLTETYAMEEGRRGELRETGRGLERDIAAAAGEASRLTMLAANARRRDDPAARALAEREASELRRLRGEEPGADGRDRPAERVLAEAAENQRERVVELTHAAEIIRERTMTPQERLMAARRGPTPMDIVEGGLSPSEVLSARAAAGFPEALPAQAETEDRALGGSPLTGELIDPAVFMASKEKGRGRGESEPERPSVNDVLRKIVKARAEARTAEKEGGSGGGASHPPPKTKADAAVTGAAEPTPVKEAEPTPAVQTPAEATPACSPPRAAESPGPAPDASSSGKPVTGVLRSRDGGHHIEPATGPPVRLPADRPGLLGARLSGGGRLDGMLLNRKLTAFLGGGGEIRTVLLDSLLGVKFGVTSKVNEMSGQPEGSVLTTKWDPGKRRFNHCTHGEVLAMLAATPRVPVTQGDTSLPSATDPPKRRREQAPRLEEGPSRGWAP